MTTAILIHSCDKYNFVLPEFFRRFKKFNLDKKFETFLTVEDEVFTSSDITTLRTNFGPWSERLAVAVKYIQADNIILFQEDFFVINVDYKALEGALSLHTQNKAHITKLGSFFEFNLEDAGFAIEGENAAIPVYKQKGGMYVMSHQPVAIFNKKFLFSTLDEHRDPWEHEIKTSEEINAGKYGEVNIFTVSNIHNPNYSDIITTHHAIRKGMFVPYEHSKAEQVCAG